MARIINRVWEVRLYRNGATKVFRGTWEQPGLRMEASIQKSSGFDPNTCDLTLTGLSSDSRELATARGTGLEVYAGYEAGGAVLLYKGSVLFGQVERDGPDWRVKLESVDGFTASPVVIEVPATATQGDVGELLRAATGANLGPVQGSLSALVDKAQVLEGSAGDLVRAWAQANALDVSIQDGRWQQYPTGTNTGEAVIVIAPESGLEGSPQRTKAGLGNMVFTAPGINASFRLNAGHAAEIRPGRVLEVRSAVLKGGKGRFAVLKVRHQLDTHGGSWTTSVEALDA